MIVFILKTLVYVAAIVGLTIWIVSLASWDGEKHCKPEDCDTCPFPPCEDEHINKH